MINLKEVGDLCANLFCLEVLEISSACGVLMEDFLRGDAIVTDGWIYRVGM